MTILLTILAIILASLFVIGGIAIWYLSLFDWSH